MTVYIFQSPRVITSGFCSSFLKSFCSWPPKYLGANSSPQTVRKSMGRNFLLVAHLNIAGRHISLVLWGKGKTRAYVSSSASLSCSGSCELLSSLYCPLWKSHLQPSNFWEIKLSRPALKLLWFVWLFCIVLFWFYDSLLFPITLHMWIICFGQIFHQILFSQI